MSYYLSESTLPVDFNNFSTHRYYQESIIQNLRKHFIVRTNIKAQKYVIIFQIKIFEIVLCYIQINIFQIIQ